MNSHEQQRAIRRQQFDQALARLEQDLGFRAPAQAPVHRPSRLHAEWKNSSAVEAHPYLLPYPGTELALARFEHQHQRDFQRQLFRHERAMQQRAHRIEIKQERGDM